VVIRKQRVTSASVMGAGVDDSHPVLDPATLDVVPEAVVVLDVAGRLRQRNDRARALLGLRDEDLGTPLHEACALEDTSGRPWPLPPARNPVADRLAEHLVYAEVRGDRRPLAVAGRWTDSGLVLTFRSAGRRERLDGVRGDVVATVSHEIRSPLTSVKGFTRTMLAKWDRFSDEQKRTMLETIDADADRVTRLLGELLDVSRIDAGRVQLHRRPVDLGDIATDVAAKARHRDLGRGRDIEVTVAPELPKVHADPDKLEQVVTNLVENALHHAPDGAVRVRVDVEGPSAVHLVVADDGPGVPADQQALVFQKFGRGRDSRSGGTGLGLYITRGLVEAHGGQVWIDPEVTSGACFHVRLPATVG
jgi:signal transduction histidine kinase